MPILYKKPGTRKFQQGGTAPQGEKYSGFTPQEKKLDTGVSRQNGRTVFVGPGLEAPMDETPQEHVVYDYKKVGIKGAPDYITMEDIKRNQMYRGKNAPDTTNYTEADYVRDLQNRAGEGYRYVQVGNRFYKQQAQPTDLRKYQYSTGQFYVTDKTGNVIDQKDYPGYFEYNPNLVVGAPALRQ